MELRLVAGRFSTKLLVMADSTDIVLARVRRVPPGYVTTYGDLTPGAPRHAGRILHDAPDGAAPWWRVVRADGSLPKGDRQRAPLVREGVRFRGARVDMATARIPADVIA